MFHFFSNPQNVLHLSSRVLGIGLVMLFSGIYGAYLYDGHLSIVTLVAMHAMTIVGPTLLKIGYVMRLLAQHRLSKPLAVALA
ncbi:transmembrane sensor/regulator PpyR [Pseudomonas sp. PD9R]|uniref:transmembrane sensor/regulator PpyR n=1 Tax=Pseudomonas sp. PD9R TaxID=2853534 RepID=UPI001C451BAD|nr:transmembrane sensor/regulator PpyR [Pseudomonas sp. PD9R]MBV6822864.1 transmembrane sensor/regulator PpyR [Pseudomonas sp. PD9R]